MTSTTCPWCSMRQNDMNCDPAGGSLSQPGRNSDAEAEDCQLGVDEFFGEGCLIGQPKRLATAAAMTDCEVMRE
jgi:CRP-like cAMP-binding protein